MPSAAGTVTVVGGGLAGMAAAARLAKMGHVVRLHEARDVLGGTWAPYTLPGTDLLVDDAPGVLGFPAPWRDLFRKSGRPLEAELGRVGYALVPAPRPTYRFADGSELVLGTDRGAQHDALLRAYGPAAAVRWQRLVDDLGEVWQTLRPLGLEDPYEAEAVTRDVARRLRSRRSVADLAEDLAEPHLRAVVRSTAHRQGTAPERAPALSAVELFADRTFGRWQVAPAEGTDGDLGRTSVLVEALVARLALRKVDVVLGSRITSLAGLTDLTGAERVVLAVDPWTAASIAPPIVDRGWRRAFRSAAPARRPTVRHDVLGSATELDGVRETITLDAEGVPVVRTHRNLGGRLVVTTLDHHATQPRPGAGLDTAGFRGWRRRPGTATAVPEVVLAGAASPVGSSPSAVLQTGALAAYAVAGRRD